MLIKDYYKLLKDADLLKESSPDAEFSEKEIKNLAYHTAKVTENTVFICKGKRFKKEYVTMAVENGAVLLICEEKYDISHVSYITVNNIRRAMSVLSEFHYQSPQKKLHCVGITGTKGKSTTAYFYKNIMDEYMASENGKPCAILSSIDNFYGGEKEESLLTTPESPDLFRYMATAVSCGINNLVMEASSQGLKYNRVDGVNYDVGIFLNIAEDHISPLEHSDFNDYFAAKLHIGDISKKLVVNLDAPEHRTFLEKFGDKCLTFSTKDESADYYAYYIRTEGKLVSFYVKSANINRKFLIAMRGDFNVSNALAALAAADLMGVPVSMIEKGLLKTKVEGRMEMISSNDEKINVIIDYAHNKLSFESLFGFLKKEFPERKLVVVFGCRGEKAYERRRDLPAIASRYCEYIFITTDDTGPEPFEKIVSEIVCNIPENVPYTVIENRETAIYTAMERFGTEAMIVLAGKGNEKTQRVGMGYGTSLSDFEIASRFISEYHEKMGL